MTTTISKRKAEDSVEEKDPKSAKVENGGPDYREQLKAVRLEFEYQEENFVMETDFETWTITVFNDLSAEFDKNGEESCRKLAELIKQQVVFWIPDCIAAFCNQTFCAPGKPTFIGSGDPDNPFAVPSDHVRREKFEKSFISDWLGIHVDNFDKASGEAVYDVLNNVMAEKIVHHNKVMVIETFAKIRHKHERAKLIPGDYDRVKQIFDKEDFDFAGQFESWLDYVNGILGAELGTNGRKSCKARASQMTECVRAWVYDCALFFCNKFLGASYYVGDEVENATEGTTVFAFRDAFCNDWLVGTFGDDFKGIDAGFVNCFLHDEMVEKIIETNDEMVSSACNYELEQDEDDESSDSDDE